MKKRRSFLLAAAALAGIGALPRARGQHALPEATVYKSPTCGCCGEWEEHLRGVGVRVDSRPSADMQAIKAELGIPEALQSCHTAVIAGYLIEGHVPASDIKRLLRERPEVRGLAVPGMPAGAPGMGDGGGFVTLAFDATGSRVFQRH